MRKSLVTGLILPALLFVAAPAAGDDAKKTDGDATAATAETAAKTHEFKPPPGFHRKKRGKYVVYCRKESVMGSRLPVEKCYDESGIREMLRAELEDREKVDQMRRICSTVSGCGGGG